MQENRGMSVEQRREAGLDAAPSGTSWLVETLVRFPRRWVAAVLWLGAAHLALGVGILWELHQISEWLRLLVQAACK
jgi:hypothetical protein